MISAATRARNPGASHFHARRDRLTRLLAPTPRTPRSPTARATSACRLVSAIVVTIERVPVLVIGEAFARPRPRTRHDDHRSENGRGGARHRTTRAAPRLFASPHAGAFDVAPSALAA